jgi:hypothetical protein
MPGKNIPGHLAFSDYLNVLIVKTDLINNFDFHERRLIVVF